MPSSVTAGTVEASSSSRVTTGRSTSPRGSWPTSTSSEPSPASFAFSISSRPRAGVDGENRRRPVTERGGDRTLAARLDLEELEHELLAFLGEGTRRRRQPFPLRERLLEGGEPFAGEGDARLEVLALSYRGARCGIGLVGGATELRGRRALRRLARLDELELQLGEQPLRRLVADAEPLRRTRGARAVHRGRRP